VFVFLTDQPIVIHKELTVELELNIQILSQIIIFSKCQKSALLVASGWSLSGGIPIFLETKAGEHVVVGK